MFSFFLFFFHFIQFLSFSSIYIFLLSPAQSHTPFSLHSHLSIFPPFPRSITYSLFPTFPLLHLSSFSPAQSHTSFSLFSHFSSFPPLPPLNHILPSPFFPLLYSKYNILDFSFFLFFFHLLSLPFSLKKINVFSTEYLCNLMMQLYNILHFIT